MFCPNCGRELNDDAVFCISCGMRLSGISVEEAPGSEPEQREKNKAPLIIGLGALAIILIIGVTCILLLDPFGSGKAAKAPDPFAHLDDVSSGGGTPQNPEVPDETVPEIAIPEGARAIVVPEQDGVGLPVPAVPSEMLKSAAELYRKFLSENASAVAYGLLDLTDTDIPELIVQEREEDGTCSYCIYHISGEEVVLIPADRIAAGGDERLLANDGRLIVLYSSGYTNTVEISSKLDVSIQFVKVDEVPEYTDSSMLIPAADKSLLSLHLLGKRDGFSGTGWIRYNGTDYYYKSGKPLTRSWVEEGDMLYYLGDCAYITEIANQELLSEVMDVYFESYQKAFNEKDASYLKYSTEANKKALDKKLRADENKFLTISDLTCQTTIHKPEDKTGKISVDVHLEYNQCGEWADAKEEQMQKDYRISLVWEDGQWYVNHMGNR